MTLRVLFLGFTVPERIMSHVLASDAAMPVQTHKLAWSIARALNEASAEVRLLSSAPVSNYPAMRQILFRSEPFTEHAIDGETLWFINLLGMKHLTRFVSCLVAGSRYIRRWKPQVLLVHGVHSPYLWFGILCRHMGTKLVVVITDPPGVPLPGDGVFVRNLRKLDIHLVKHALAHADGVVALTRALANDFAPGRPQLVMEGILDRALQAPSSPLSTVLCHSEYFQIVYAGGLSRAYGVDRLVEAVRAMPDSDVRLLVFGKGELDSDIHEASRIDPRIQHFGFRSHAEVLPYLMSADILVNPRPIAQSFVKYSFPSKLLEYLATGTPVLTTRLDGIPEDYEPYLFFTDDDTAKGFTEALKNMKKLDATQLSAVGHSARSFALKSRSTASQGARLRTFLCSLAD